MAHADQQDVPKASVPSVLPAQRNDSSSKSSNVMTLSSFAALLSSSQTNCLQHLLLPLSEPSLAKFLSPLVEFDSTNPQAWHCVSFPGLTLRNAFSAAEDRSTSGMSLQDMAALNLAIPVCTSREDIDNAPRRMLQNVSDSFLKLIDSRLRSSLSALVRQTLNMGNTSEAQLIMELLSRGNAVKVTTVVTSFRVLPNPNGAHAATQGRGGMETTLPLAFEAVVDVSPLGKLVTVALQTSGTITGRFHPEDGLLQQVEVAFDTIALLQSMMKQARVVVRKAVSRAATVATKARQEQHHPFLAAYQSNSCHPLSSSLSSVASLSSLTSALSCHSSMEALTGLAGNKRERTEASVDTSNAPPPQMPLNNTTESLFHSAEGFPSLLRDTMAMISQENSSSGNMDLSRMADCRAPLSSSNEDPNSSHEDPTQGHSQPLTLSSLYARQDRARREAEERAKRIRTLNSESGHKKVELFSWLKGDSMLLKDEEEEEQLMGAAASQSLHRPSSPQKVGFASSDVASLASLTPSLGVPAAFAGGHLPTTFSSLSTTDLGGLGSTVTQPKPLSALMLRRNSDPSRHGSHASSGPVKRKTSFRNESFGSAGSGRESTRRRLKKQVSFSLKQLKHNDTFPVEL